MVTAVAVIAASCGGGSSPGVGAQPRTGALTTAELRYGLAPDEHPKVTYQPDVVVVGGGADSVVSATADGTTFTLKPDAPHVKDLEVGKVMVLTNEATGRILSLGHASAGIVVQLLPVQLGEVFKDAKLSFDVPIHSNEIGFDQVPQPGGETSAAPAQSPIPTQTTTTAPAPPASTPSTDHAAGQPAQRRRSWMRRAARAADCSAKRSDRSPARPASHRTSSAAAPAKRQARLPRAW